MSQYIDTAGAPRPRRMEEETSSRIDRGELPAQSQMPHRWPRGYAGGLSRSSIVWATAAGLLLLVLVVLLVMMSSYRW